MRIQIVSDLHYEFSYMKLKVPLDVDVVVVAGDLTSAGRLDLLETFLKHVEVPVVYIPGNHEYYGSQMKAVDLFITDLMNEYENLSYLNGASIVYGGLRFVGCTLWSNLDLDPTGLLAERLPYGINDFNQIKVTPVRYLNVGDIVDMNLASREYLRGVIEASKEPVVVVTHFGPTRKSIAPEYAGSLLNPYFACNCEDLFMDNVKCWIHGHTHGTIREEVNGIPVIANPRGYHTENKRFDSKFAIDLDL